MTGNNEKTRRAIVLGFDGVPWDLIDAWTETGNLQNFTLVRQQGATGPLESTTPATTPVAWPSIATGSRPDNHGIYDFQRLLPEYTHRMYTNADIRRSTLWELLTPAIVGNVPMTYPARKIDGILVTGMMTPDMDKGFTYPPEFADDINRTIPDYRINLNWNDFKDRPAEFRTELTGLLETRRSLMRLLMAEDRWRLFFFVYTAPDRLQHLLWDEKMLFEHYQQLDDILGEIMEYASDHNATLFIVSDHGFGPISKFVSVNRILESESFLTRRQGTGTRSILTPIGVDKDVVLSVLETFGIDGGTLLKYLPRSLVDRIASHVPGEHVLYDVDYANTTAFFHGSGSIYVNDTRRFTNGNIDPSEIPCVKAELRSILSSVTDPETNESILSIYDGEELFPADNQSPDLVVKGKDGYEVEATLSNKAIHAADGTAASHRSEGIFLAYGPNIEAGVELKTATVYDVLPTVLHAAGEPVPVDVDGRVLVEIFEPGSIPAVTSIQTQPSRPRDGGDRVEEDFTDVENRLRGLGYLE